METQSNSNKILDGDKVELLNQQGNVNEFQKFKKRSTGIDYHDYMPKHSSHGRINNRGFGSDHEPGTMR